MAGCVQRRRLCPAAAVRECAVHDGRAQALAAHPKLLPYCSPPVCVSACLQVICSQRTFALPARPPVAGQLLPPGPCGGASSRTRMQPRRKPSRLSVSMVASSRWNCTDTSCRGQGRGRAQTAGRACSSEGGQAIYAARWERLWARRWAACTLLPAPARRRHTPAAAHRPQHGCRWASRHASRMPMQQQGIKRSPRTPLVTAGA